VFVWFIKYGVAITKGIYAQLIRSTTSRFFEGGNAVPHEKIYMYIYIRKINLQEKLEFTES